MHVMSWQLLFYSKAVTVVVKALSDCNPFCFTTWFCLLWAWKAIRISSFVAHSIAAWIHKSFWFLECIRICDPYSAFAILAIGVHIVCKWPMFQYRLKTWFLCKNCWCAMCFRIIIACCELTSLFINLVRDSKYYLMLDGLWGMELWEVLNLPITACNKYIKAAFSWEQNVTKHVTIKWNSEKCQKIWNDVSSVHEVTKVVCCIVILPLNKFRKSTCNVNPELSK